MTDRPVTPTGRTEDAPHDVLAADEFAVGARDPALHDEPAHDVLAADEFGVPGEDARLRPGPVTLPDDPAGIAEPHDVLAAEEFALPAGHDDEPGTLGATRGRSRWVLAGGLAAAVALLWRARR